jgi:hypothetical protein
MGPTKYPIYMSTQRGGQFPNEREGYLQYENDVVDGSTYLHTHRRVNRFYSPSHLRAEHRRSIYAMLYIIQDDSSFRSFSR